MLLEVRVTISVSVVVGVTVERVIYDEQNELAEASFEDNVLYRLSVLQVEVERFARWPAGIAATETARKPRSV